MHCYGVMAFDGLHGLHHVYFTNQETGTVEVSISIDDYRLVARSIAECTITASIRGSMRPSVSGVSSLCSLGEEFHDCSYAFRFSC